MRPLLLWLIVAPGIVAAQYPFSATQLGGPTGSFGFGDAAYTSTGLLVCVGGVSQTNDLDPGPGITTVNGYAQGTGFMAVYAPDLSLVRGCEVGGTYTWVHRMGLSGADHFAATGEFMYDADLDPGPDQYLISSWQDRNLFVTMLDADGALRWGHGIGGAGDDSPGDVKFDGDGCVLLSGMLADTCDLDPGPDTALFASAGNDAFVMKFDTIGQLLWADRFGLSNGFDQIPMLTVRPSGHVIALLEFNDSVDVDPGPDQLIFHETEGNRVIMELDADGDLVWAKQTAAVVGDIALESDGSMYMCGGSWGTTDLDPGAGTFTTSMEPGGLFLSKLDPDGDLIWARLFGPTTNVQNNRDLKLTSTGQLLLAGDYTGTLDLDPGPGEWMAPATQFDEGYVSQFDTLGNFIGALAAFGTDLQGFSAVAPSPDGGFAAVGSFQTEMQFYPACEPPAMTATSNENGVIITSGDISLPVQQSSSAAADVRIWPQPAATFVQLTGLPAGPRSASLYDLTGRMEHNWALTTTTDRLTLDIGELPCGMHHIVLTSADGTKVLPLVIAR
jgi:hypothetical protein